MGYSDLVVSHVFEVFKCVYVESRGESEPSSCVALRIQRDRRGSPLFTILYSLLEISAENLYTISLTSQSFNTISL